MIFEGDKSVGKNMCAETLAYILHLPFDMITMTRGMGGDELYGTKVTDLSASANLTPEMAQAKIYAYRERQIRKRFRLLPSMITGRQKHHLSQSYKRSVPLYTHSNTAVSFV